MPFVCGTCGKELATKSSLRQHEGRHKQVGKYTCTTCTMVSFSKSNYERHMKTHNSQRNHICERCQASFVCKRDLERHMMRESGRGELKRFGCDQCGQAFEDRSKLSDHMDVHTGTKRHTCSICHKSFRYISSLSRHRKTHKQNRSTEGCSTLKRSVDMTSSGKNGLNIRTNASHKS